MTQTPEDTDPAFQQRYLAKLAAMEPGEKIQRMFALSHLAGQFVCAGIKERYSNASPQELKIRYAAMLFGREFVQKHFSGDPVLERL
jgi:hypothetical protein